MDGSSRLCRLSGLRLCCSSVQLRREAASPAACRCKPPLLKASCYRWPFLCSDMMLAQKKTEETKKALAIAYQTAAHIEDKGPQVSYKLCMSRDCLLQLSRRAGSVCRQPGSMHAALMHWPTCAGQRHLALHRSCALGPAPHRIDIPCPPVPDAGACPHELRLHPEERAQGGVHARHI